MALLGETSIIVPGLLPTALSALPFPLPDAVLVGLSFNRFAVEEDRRAVPVHLRFSSTDLFRFGLRFLVLVFVLGTLIRSDISEDEVLRDADDQV